MLQSVQLQMLQVNVIALLLWGNMVCNLWLAFGPAGWGIKCSLVCLPSHRYLSPGPRKGQHQALQWRWALSWEKSYVWNDFKEWRIIERVIQHWWRVSLCCPVIEGSDLRYSHRTLVGWWKYVYQMVVSITCTKDVLKISFALLHTEVTGVLYWEAQNMGNFIVNHNRFYTNSAINNGKDNLETFTTGPIMGYELVYDGNFQILCKFHL